MVPKKKKKPARGEPGAEKKRGGEGSRAEVCFDRRRQKDGILGPGWSTPMDGSPGRSGFGRPSEREPGAGKHGGGWVVSSPKKREGEER